MINERKIQINLGSIRGKNDYIKKMADVFSFPNYFGGNLAALMDCMRDLSWFPEEEIAIKIKNLERLKEKNSKLYLLVASTIEEYWDGSYEGSADKKVTVYK